MYLFYYIRIVEIHTIMMTIHEMMAIIGGASVVLCFCLVFAFGCIAYDLIKTCQGNFDDQDQEPDPKQKAYTVTYPDSMA